MGDRALRPCAEPGCGVLVRGGRCQLHMRAKRKEEDSLRPADHAFYRTYAWQQMAARQLAREPLCRACRAEGRLVPASDADHVVPRSEGGKDVESNLQSLCRRHHSRKTLGEVRARKAARLGRGAPPGPPAPRGGAPAPPPGGAAPMAENSPPDTLSGQGGG